MPHRVTAAVSGGADSVALLLVLAELARKEGVALSAVHVDHGLRVTSGQDAAFVERLCAEIDVPCRIVRVQVNGKSEDAAREARYDALSDGCAAFQSAVLALAHHRRDQAETMLLHLFRGSGGGGLSAMGERSTRSWPERGPLLLWRPFLDVPPDILRQALREKDVSWREDETNARDDYLRNFIRHQVLPKVEERIPEAEAAMGRAAKVLSEEYAYFRAEAARFLARDGNACLYDPCRWVRYAPLTRLHPALRRHALRMICPVKMDFEQTETLMALAPGHTVNLPEGWRAKCTETYLHFLPPVGKELSPAPPMPGTLYAQPWNGETGDGKRVQAMPRNVYEKCVLRFRQPGDVIRPFGGPGDKSLQDYLVDRKVDQPFRDYVPLLCVGNRVIWCVGVGPGEEARVSPGDDAVLLRYEGFLPGDTPDQYDNDSKEEGG